MQRIIRSSSPCRAERITNTINRAVLVVELLAVDDVASNPNIQATLNTKEFRTAQMESNKMDRFDSVFSSEFPSWYLEEIMIKTIIQMRGGTTAIGASTPK